MNSIIRRLAALSLTGAVCALIAGCDNSYLDQGSGRSEQPISTATLAEMAKLDTTPSSPTLIRTYKMESELEIWKMKSNGEYALLKTYPMCRWSGQLGPKKKEGDMQVPEGFYPIAPGQMNPNSHYYLAFNVGYPNAYDRAYGRTGGTVMVHGVCSSAGCFSMTDEQVADIYAIARNSFRGGQREIQLQSYPFHMTAENLAKFRFDPNIEFWKELKNGSDHFEVVKQEPPVLVCGKRYVFGATSTGRSPQPSRVRRSSATKLSRRWWRRRRARTTSRQPNSSPPASSRCVSFMPTADKIQSLPGTRTKAIRTRSRLVQRRSFWTTGRCPCQPPSRSLRPTRPNCAPRAPRPRRPRPRRWILSPSQRRLRWLLLRPGNRAASLAG